MRGAPAAGPLALLRRMTLLFNVLCGAADWILPARLRTCGRSSDPSSFVPAQRAGPIPHPALAPKFPTSGTTPKNSIQRGSEMRGPIPLRNNLEASAGSELPVTMPVRSGQRSC